MMEKIFYFIKVFLLFLQIEIRNNLDRKTKSTKGECFLNSILLRINIEHTLILQDKTCSCFKQKKINIIINFFLKLITFQVQQL